MNLHQKRIDIFKKYQNEMKKSPYPIYVSDNIPATVLLNAIKKYANTAKIDEVIALCDGSLFSNGKSGFLFTDTCMYCTQIFGDPQCINYLDILECRVLEDNNIQIKFKSGRELRTYNSALNHETLKNFLYEIKELNEQTFNSDTEDVLKDEVVPDADDRIYTNESQDSTLTDAAEALPYDKNPVDVLALTEYYFSLDEYTRGCIDFILLSLKLLYLSTGKPYLTDEDIISIVQNFCEKIECVDDNAVEYLSMEMNEIQNNKTFCFNDLIKDLNLYSTEKIEEIYHMHCDNNDETSKEFNNCFLQYVNSRKKEDRKNLSFSQRHPIINGLLTDIKDGMIDNAGKALGARQSEIDKWKSGGAEGFIDMLGRVKEVSEATRELEEDNVSNRSVYNDNLNTSTNKYDAALKRRGIDLRYYKSLPQSEKAKYLKDRGINSQQDLKKIFIEANKEAFNND